MKRENHSRAAGAGDGAAWRAVERLKAHIDKLPRPSSSALVAEQIRHGPFKELIAAGRYQVLTNVEDTIAILRVEGERVTVIRCVEDSPELHAMNASYGAECPRNAWTLPEHEEAPRDFLARSLSRHKPDILIVQNAMQFARLCGYQSFQEAEPLWTELATMAATAQCQVTLIRFEA